MFLKRFSLLLAFTILIGFSAGFFTGRLNDRILMRLGIKPPKIRVLVESRKLFPENLQHTLEKETGYQIETQVYENGDALARMVPYFDIFLGSTCLIEDIKIEGENISLERMISPDFITINQRQKSVVPLLWTYNKKDGFQVISMRMKKRKKSYLRDLVGNWIQGKFIQRWVETTDLATTFMTLDESSLEPELKASWLRTIPLSKLTLLDKTSCHDDKK